MMLLDSLPTVKPQTQLSLYHGRMQDGPLLLRTTGH